MSGGIFFLIITWVIISLVVGYLAGQRGRDPFEFFLLSLVISPLIAFLILIALPIKNPDEQQKVKCPHCHGLIDEGVKCCMHCRRDIEWKVIVQDFPKNDLDTSLSEIPQKVDTVDGDLIDCQHCGKMFLHCRTEDGIACCPHCRCPQRIPLKQVKEEAFKADCPDCGKTFPIRANLGIIETLCPHCQTILKLDTAIS